MGELGASRLSYPRIVYQQSLAGINNMVLSKVPLGTRQHVYEFLDCDCVIDFNIRNGVYWNFGNGTIGAVEYDFKLLAAHYITKCLGFYSNFHYYQYRYVGFSRMTHRESLAGMVTLQTENRFTNLSFISPLDDLLHAERTIAQSNCVNVPICNPTSQLDSTPLSQTAIKFRQLGLDDKNMSSYKLNMIETLRYNQIAKELYQLLQGSVLVADFADGDVLLMDSVNLGQIHNDLYHTKEFLMTGIATGIRGYNLSRLMELRNMTRVYGPLTLKVMERVGYATYLHPRGIQFE